MQPTSAFDFPSLLDELQGEITSWLDLPSRFALALTCPRFYRRFFILGNKKLNPYFENWAFMEECARLGHIKLLQWAHSFGARLDSLVLEAAINAGQGEVSSWLLQTLKKKCISYEEMFYPEADSAKDKVRKLGVLAAQRGLEDVAIELLGDTPMGRWAVASNLLAGGHYEHAKNLSTLPLVRPSPGLGNISDSDYFFDAHDRDDSASWPLTIIEASALRSDLPLFNKLFPDFIHVSHLQAQLRLFVLGVKGCCLDIIRRTFETCLRTLALDATDVASLLASNLLSKDNYNFMYRLDILDYLMEAVPGIEDSLGLLGWACAYPRLDVFKRLWVDLENRFPVLFCSYSDMWRPEHLLIMRNSRVARMECLHFMIEQGVRWDSDSLNSAWWANFEDLKWLSSNCSTEKEIDQETYKSLLIDYLKSGATGTLRADIDLLSFLLEKVDLAPLTCVLEIGFLVNAPEVFEQLEENLIEKIRGPLALQGLLETMATISSNKRFVREKLRPRPNLWSRTIKAMVRRGFLKGSSREKVDAFIFNLKKTYPEFDPKLDFND